MAMMGLSFCTNTSENKANCEHKFFWLCPHLEVPRLQYTCLLAPSALSAPLHAPSSPSAVVEAAEEWLNLDLVVHLDPVDQPED